MNIKRAKQEIKDTIAAYLQKDEFGTYVIPSIRQRPILLIGPPGVGKTQIMEQISQECQIGLVAYTITHHTRQSAVGLPMIERKRYGEREYAVTEYTMSEIVAAVYDKMEQTGKREGILFLDEINCVSETLAPTMLQFLQAKMFGNHKIPQGWIIVAAGNPPEYNKSVREFDMVTMDRIRRIDVEPDFQVWNEYANQAEIHPAIRAYLSVKKEYFCCLETTVDGRLFATPRGWEDLSRLLEVYENMGLLADRELIAEYIQHPKIAKDFANYLELYRKYQDDYQVSRILEGDVPERVYDKLERAAFDERISVVGLLLAGLNGAFSEVCRFADCMELRMKWMREVQEMSVQCGQMPDSGNCFLEQCTKKLQGLAGEWQLWEEQGMVSRRDQLRNRRVLAMLEADIQAARTLGASESEQVWNDLSARFAEDSDRYEAFICRAGEKLEHAFDFMEAAFGNSQEMALFVTELNTGRWSVAFLQEYDCGRYYEYNKNLLFSEEEEQIRAMLS